MVRVRIVLLDELVISVPQKKAAACGVVNNNFTLP
jgi:hypothetical protein